MFFDIQYELTLAFRKSQTEWPFEKTYEGEVAHEMGYKPGKCVPRVWKNICGRKTVFAPGFNVGDENVAFLRHVFTSERDAIALAKELASDADHLEELGE